MINSLMFSRASDEWATPDDLYATLDAEFHFRLDAAATMYNWKCERYYGSGGVYNDALVEAWVDKDGQRCPVWLNPPYSQCREFITKAASEVQNGGVVVCLVPSRTDTRWWHDYVWDRDRNAPRPGVEIRFIKGRLKFNGATNGAPFPSVIIIFRTPTEVS